MFVFKREKVRVLRRYHSETLHHVFEGNHIREGEVCVLERCIENHSLKTWRGPGVFGRATCGGTCNRFF